jgi:gamma-glutamyltranspeptidase/glutathione hydrolase
MSLDSASSQQKAPAHTPTSSPQVIGTRWAVAAGHFLASEAGARVLAAGGNAIDAILATAITLTLVEPVSNGIGSDAYAIVWDGKKLHGLNASGRSPAGWTLDYFAKHGRIPESQPRSGIAFLPAK